MGTSLLHRATRATHGFAWGAPTATGHVARADPLLPDANAGIVHSRHEKKVTGSWQPQETVETGSGWVGGWVTTCRPLVSTLVYGTQLPSPSAPGQ